MLITTPYWWDNQEPVEISDRPQADQIEVAVIGGGFTGLSAALTCVEKGAETVLFDAEQPGFGASTRNGGMIGAPHRHAFERDLKIYGRDLTARLAQEGSEAYHYTRSLYTNGNIDADFQPVGRIQLANTMGQFLAMKEKAEILNGLHDQGIQVVERDQLSQHIRSDIYFGGLHYPDHGGLHPRKAHDGLLKKALSAGVTVQPHTPVLDVHRRANGYELRTSKGSIIAKKLIVATNGYTTPVIRWLSRRIFRIPSYLIATEELPADVVSRVAPGRHMMVESRARHSYFRPSPDGKRIVFGGRAALVPIDEYQAARRLQKTLSDIWPEARDWKITHSWQGFTGFTFALTPHLGEIDGIQFAMGYCGNGVALSPWLGRKAALRALGDPEGQSAYAETRLESRLYHLGGKPWFMQLASPWWRHVVDARETRTAQRDLRARASSKGKPEEV